MKLEELKKLSAAATKEPWFAIGKEYGATHIKVVEDNDSLVVEAQEENGELIAAMRNHFDALLAVAEASKKFLQGIHGTQCDCRLCSQYRKLEELK
jgi:hypothetical protein